MKVLDCPVCGSNTVIITKEVKSVTYFGPKGTIASGRRSVNWRIRCEDDKCTIHPELEIDTNNLNVLVRRWNLRNFARNYLIPKYRCFNGGKS